MRTQRSSFPIAMEFLHAYLTKTTPNPIPPWQMRRSKDFVDAVDRMRRRITAVLERCAEAAERVGTRTAYLDSVESIMGGDDFDQHKDSFNQWIRDSATRLFALDLDFDIAALDALEKAGLAKKFEVGGSWSETDFPVFPPQGT